MTKISSTFARLAALFKETSLRSPTVVPGWQIEGYLKRYNVLRSELMSNLPDLYADLPLHAIYETRYPNMDDFRQMVRDMEYIFEVRANSELNVELSEPKEAKKAVASVFRVFISHGRSGEWREVQAFIEKDLNISTLELAQEPNRGRTVLQKLNDEAAKCSFAVIVMTGDDEVGKGELRARENVLHEIGFFQGKLGLENICLLHEEGTNIPSNIHGLVYVPFPKTLISASFGVLGRELRAALEKLS